MSINSITKRSGKYNDQDNHIRIEDVTKNELLIVGKFKDEGMNEKVFTSWSSIVNRIDFTTMFYNLSRSSTEEEIELDMWLNNLGDDTNMYERKIEVDGTYYVITFVRQNCEYDNDDYIKVMSEIRTIEGEEFESESYMKIGTLRVLAFVFNYLDDNEYYKLKDEELVQK